MTRHGVVIPSPNLVPPPECKGGPAFCSTCNVEMIELETLAIRLAFGYERKYDYTAEEFESLWQARGYKRNYFRAQAARLIRLREEDEGQPRIDRVRSPRVADAHRAEAKRQGVSMWTYRSRRVGKAAKLAGVSTRGFYNLSPAERNRFLTKVKIPVV